MSGSGGASPQGPPGSSAAAGPASSYSPGGSPPLPSGPKRGGLYAGIAAVVIVVAVVLGLGFANVIPGFHLGKAGGGPGPTPDQYSVTFSEAGLTKGTTWSVTLAGSTRSSSGSPVQFTEGNGSYAFSIGRVSGYTASPSSGTVTVNGASVTQAVAFSPSAVATYSVTFTEAGLPSGTAWSLTLSGSPGSGSAPGSITFNEPNGTYSYSIGSVAGYTASPSSGSATVSGADVSQAITFTPIPPTTYAVTFTETGLPSGTEWSVTVSGSTVSALAPAAASLSEANGTYSYTVGSVAGYTASPSSGSVTVNGAAVTETITFTPSAATMYAVTLTESGLPSGTAWSAMLNGVTGGASAPGSIMFSESNGTYSFTIGSVVGYTANPSSGSVTVNGAAVTQTIVFSSSTAPVYPVTFTESGLPSGTAWSVMLGGVPEGASAPASIVFDEPNGTYSYTVGSIAGYTASPSSGSVTVNGAAVTQTATFSPVSAGGYYAVTLTSQGLPAGSGGWALDVVNSAYSFYGLLYESGSTAVFELPNGTYYASASSFNSNYTTSPPSHEFNVTGAPESEVFVFTPIPPPSGYPVTFSESGLPSGTSWYASLYNEATGSSQEKSGTGSTITLLEPNGTYYFGVGASGYAANPGSGILTVDGAGVTQSIQFTRVVTPATYTITFTETGLASGDYWSVTSEGTTSAYAPNSIVFSSLSNGTYSFTASAPGYSANPASGSVTVNGADASEAITFRSTAAVYPVTFIESGLPSTSFWTVAVGNVTTLTGNTSASSETAITLPNGAYGWSALGYGYSGTLSSATIKVYMATPSSGIVTVSGGAVSVDLKFSALPRGTYLVEAEAEVEPFGSSSNISSGAAWSVTVGTTTQHLAGPISAYFAEANGTYSWSVTPPTGVTALSRGGAIAIAGSLFSSSAFGGIGAILVFGWVAAPSGTVAGPSASAGGVAPSPFSAGAGLAAWSLLVVGALVAGVPGDSRRSGPRAVCGTGPEVRCASRVSASVSRPVHRDLDR